MGRDEKGKLKGRDPRALAAIGGALLQRDTALAAGLARHQRVGLLTNYLGKIGSSAVGRSGDFAGQPPRAETSGVCVEHGAADVLVGRG